ncbi:2-phosphoxylose phosphatase 1-like [Antedon mediterranea]|uniref:2-phosphoxylose phosphatase 1-like n=1 Tax=Antedon mediterranea TaxID=105859 RepID=UPI003AF57233
MMGGKIVWRYLSLAVVACFIISFYSWYALSSTQTRGNPTPHTVKMPNKLFVPTDNTVPKKEESLDNLQRRVHAKEEVIEMISGENNEEWLPKYYANMFNNNTLISYLKERLLGYCNPPEVPTTGKEGLVVPGYSLESVHILIRHGDRTPLESNGMGSSADINCNLMIVSETLPDKMFELLATDFNEWKELLRKEDELMLSDMKLKSSLQKSAVSTLNMNYVSALLTDSNKCRTSQLTPSGWRQHLAIGDFLRKVYTPHKLFNPQAIDHKDIMNLQTTSFSRTMQSAIALLYGLLPEDQILKTPPMKIARALNFCYGASCNCPAAQQLLNTVSSEKAKHKTDNSYTREISKGIKKVLYDKTPNSPKLPHFFALLDHFTSFLCHGEKLPCGPTKCIELDQVQQVFQYVDKLEQDLKAHEDTTSMKHARLFMYPLLKDIADAIARNKTDHRFSLYSGHDLTITPFLAILGLSDFRWPNYASRIVIEAWSKAKMVFIRVLYNGDDMTSNVSFCRNKLNQDGLCPLNKLLDFVNKQNFVLFESKSYKKACFATQM